MTPSGVRHLSRLNYRFRIKNLGHKFSTHIQNVYEVSWLYVERSRRRYQIKNLTDKFLNHIEKIMFMKFDGSRPIGLGGDRFCICENMHKVQKRPKFGPGPRGPGAMHQKSDRQIFDPYPEDHVYEI